jgi:hypothetical protein
MMKETVQITNGLLRPRTHPWYWIAPEDEPSRNLAQQEPCNKNNEEIRKLTIGNFREGFISPQSYCISDIWLNSFSFRSARLPLSYWSDDILFFFGDELAFIFLSIQKHDVIVACYVAAGAYHQKSVACGPNVGLWIRTWSMIGEILFIIRIVLQPAKSWIWNCENCGLKQLHRL